MWYILALMYSQKEVITVENMKGEIISLNELEELEDMVCLGDGGTYSCCNGRDGNSSNSANVNVG